MRFIWERLSQAYDLNGFKGQKLTSANNFPDEVNEKGVALIDLECSLGIGRKYMLPIYFMKIGENVFKKVQNVENYYPEIKRI